MTYTTNLSEQLLIDRLQEAGLRLTLPRRAICRALAEANQEFLSAALVIERVKETAGQIDASTVYRTLDELDRIGLVHHFHLGNGLPGTWHLTLEHDHQHLVCENCCETIQVPQSEFAVLYKTLDADYGFQPTNHHFAIVGLCDECQPVVDHPHHAAQSNSS